jgi:hypothetical protein
MMTASKKDLLWICVVSILILILSSIPTWAGYQAATKELRFRGIFFDSQDYAVHIATMQAARQGEWAYRFRFTTEPHNAVHIRLFYIALGHVSKWLGLGPEVAFQLARWVLGMGALFTLYELMQRVYPDLFWSRTAFLLAVLGSGLGWLQVALNWTLGPVTPIDFWLIDDYVFFSLAVFPHFAFVTAGMCIALLLWLDFLETPSWKKIMGIGLTAVLVQLVNPIAFATLDVSLLGCSLFSWWRVRKIQSEHLRALLIVALIQMPLLIYNFIVLKNDPLWSQFTAQNQTPSPPALYYFWGFALFWLPAIIGLAAAFRSKSSALGGAFFWVICGFVLAYIPFAIQRRFLQNVTIPLAIVATTGLMSLFERGEMRNPSLIRWRSSLVIMFVFLTSISSIQIGLSQVAYLQTHPDDLFYPASLDQAIGWFREHAQYNDFVLASEQTSQVLAQKAGLRVYAGHEMETLHYKDKLLRVQAFFQGNLPELASYPIKWVVFGPAERELSATFPRPDNLELVYDTQDLQIYRVK